MYNAQLVSNYAAQLYVCIDNECTYISCYYGKDYAYYTKKYNYISCEKWVASTYISDSGINADHPTNDSNFTWYRSDTRNEVYAFDQWFSLDTRFLHW